MPTNRRATSVVKELVKEAAEVIILDQINCPKESFSRYSILLKVPNHDGIKIECTETQDEKVLVEWLNEHLVNLTPKVIGFSFRELKNDTPISWIQFSTKTSNVMYRIRDNEFPSCVSVVFKMKNWVLLGTNVVEKYLKPTLVNFHGIDDLVGPSTEFIVVDPSTVSKSKFENGVFTPIVARLTLLATKLKEKSCNWHLGKLQRDQILFAVLELHLGINIYSGGIALKNC
ncbi:hypothetical protein MKW94_001632 [Papaver nudicaule]|uniref:Uncharacterized protein n=1 Tax=Papaver nudicaule TaxID=74823 RepID=A0AA41RVP1_PAPNU|nr:hypothetical protein [Papaver nudicaule]